MHNERLQHAIGWTQQRADFLLAEAILRQPVNPSLAHRIEMDNSIRLQPKEARRTFNVPLVLASRLSRRASVAFGRSKASPVATMSELLGCSVRELIKHLEAQFTGGIAWSNMHLWHIDHKRPISSFDLRNAEHQRQCFNYRNLQPLWARDNLRKHAKWDGTEEPGQALVSPSDERSLAPQLSRA